MAAFADHVVPGGGGTFCWPARRSPWWPTTPVPGPVLPDGQAADGQRLYAARRPTASFTLHS